MNDNKQEFQNVYPAYNVRRLPAPPQEKLVPEEIVKANRFFTPPLAEKIYLARKTFFRQVNWARVDTIVILILMLTGALFIFPGGWTDSPASQEVASSHAMIQAGLLICVVVPLGYLLLRWYAGRGMWVIGIIGVVVAWFGLCNFTGAFGYTFVDSPSSTIKAIHWGLIIFGSVSFIYGTMVRLYSTIMHLYKQ